MFTWRLNLLFRSKLSPRWHWPSHLHLNGSVEAHLLSSFLQPDRLNKSQWADENRKTLLLCYTNSICLRSARLHTASILLLHLLLCSELSSYHLGNYKVSCSPSFFAEHLARVLVMSINLHLQFLIGSATSIKYYFRTKTWVPTPGVLMFERWSVSFLDASAVNKKWSTAL